MSDLLWLIPALPLLGSALIAFLGPKFLKGQSHWPCILGSVGACVVSAIVFTHIASNPTPDIHSYYTWMATGDFNIGMSLRADALTGVMLMTVTFVGSLITIYSAGYMRGDPGYPRYFAAVALFIASMCGLVLADNFILLYACWEGVGLCSYLLVGFWFAKPSAAAAARKAFLVTRIGDFGFLLGILLLWANIGSLDYQTVFANVNKLSEGTVLAICLLLFCGAVGKSAQFPLHVWLPDAMEGPSPVSALIHAATMVTAGVYMVARCMPLFRAAPVALAVVAGIGAISAFLAALCALTQTDLKRVLAYSTISQLGYMFLGLGSAVTDELVPVAVVAGIFHLFTHACFKALLFLSAGSVMHSMNNIIDMRRFSGLRKILPLTNIAFFCGALALSGLPVFSGFWSKDECIGASFKASHAGTGLGHYYTICFLLGLVTAGLTAFYTFRAYFLTFWGELKVPPEAEHHAHENPPVMTIPMLILSVFAVAAGIVVQPFTHWFSDYLTLTPGLGRLHEHGLDWILMGGSTLFVLAGLGTAWWFYIRKPGTADELAASSPGLYELSKNKFYIDEIYDWAVVKAMAGWAVFCRIFDQQLVDGIVDLIAYIPRFLGLVFRPIQNGLVQFYALAMVLGLTVFLVALVRALGGP